MHIAYYQKYGLIFQVSCTFELNWLIAVFVVLYLPTKTITSKILYPHRNMLFNQTPLLDLR